MSQFSEPPSSPPPSKRVQSANTDDPGLFWCLNSTDIHQALGMAGAPLHQGATADDSMRSFKKYMYDELCAKTPLNKSVNGVLLKIVSGAKQYSHFTYT
jgi:hypothetical protein